jgi:hypothetical protein
MLDMYVLGSDIDRFDRDSDLDTSSDIDRFDRDSDCNVYWFDRDSYWHCKNSYAGGNPLIILFVIIWSVPTYGPILALMFALMFALLFACCSMCREERGNRTFEYKLGKDHIPKGFCREKVKATKGK